MRTLLPLLLALTLLTLPASPDLSWQSVPEWATPRSPYNGCCESLWASTGESCGTGSYTHGPVPCLSDEDADMIRSLGDKAPEFLREALEARDRAIESAYEAEIEPYVTEFGGVSIVTPGRRGESPEEHAQRHADAVSGGPGGGVGTLPQW